LEKSQKKLHAFCGTMQNKRPYTLPYVGPPAVPSQFRTLA